MSETQLPPVADSISSIAFHPSNPDLLLSSSWDKHVHLYNLNDPTDVKRMPLRGAVLDVAWGDAREESKCFAGGLGTEVRWIDFSTSESSLTVKHDAPVKCIEYSPDLNAVISASWDSTLRITDPLSSKSTTVNLPGKAYTMALSKSKIIIGTAARHFLIYDIRSTKEAIEQGSEVEPWQTRESSLKFMTRSVSCMPNDQGYSTSSIEGRVAVEFFDPDPKIQAKKYAFKCHRQVIEGVDTVYPVQGLAYNPAYGTFATGGGDCTVSLWDPAAKKRLKQYPKYPSPISALSFNCDGTRLAIAYSENDEGGAGMGKGNGNGIIVREVGDECKPKAKA